ncbi:hypothetical protein BAZSYMB_SCAFFOLD00021_16 [Bathymodiolus azoricus thioautotrophic gill symbiont]|uniref:Uncharacterized protein n=2 Tax=sulfur-oxidizing symbionts TaxID=32036 RepID=A0A1H6KW15_9GAMM|nr:hypothetical protein BAZSYMB_SCAFFOLD00021_16 [Bathymodiolus azoricus thioautotrophic gill symbiont]
MQRSHLSGFTKRFRNIIANNKNNNGESTLMVEPTIF